MIPDDDVLSAVAIFFVTWCVSAGVLTYLRMGVAASIGDFSEVPVEQAKRQFTELFIYQGIALAIPVGLLTLQSWEAVAWAAGLIGVYWLWKLGRWWWNK